MVASEIRSFFLQDFFEENVLTVPSMVQAVPGVTWEMEIQREKSSYLAGK